MSFLSAYQPSVVTANLSEITFNFSSAMSAEENVCVHLRPPAVNASIFHKVLQELPLPNKAQDLRWPVSGRTSRLFCLAAFPGRLFPGQQRSQLL
jgi:hypothetical protein